MFFWRSAKKHDVMFFGGWRRKKNTPRQFWRMAAKKKHATSNSGRIPQIVRKKKHATSAAAGARKNCTKTKGKRHVAAKKKTRHVDSGQEFWPAVRKKTRHVNSGRWLRKKKHGTSTLAGMCEIKNMSRALCPLSVRKIKLFYFSHRS